MATLVNEQIFQESSTIYPETPAIVCAASSRLPNQMDQLAARVSSKLEDGDYRGAIRLACSEDVLAEHTSHTLDALRVMHPPTPPPPPHTHTMPIDLMTSSLTIEPLFTSPLKVRIF